VCFVSASTLVDFSRKTGRWVEYLGQRLVKVASVRPFIIGRIKRYPKNL
jgi:hypothetical protein